MRFFKGRWKETNNGGEICRAWAGKEMEWKMLSSSTSLAHICFSSCFCWSSLTSIVVVTSSKWLTAPMIPGPTVVCIRICMRSASSLTRPLAKEDTELKDMCNCQKVQDHCQCKTLFVLFVLLRLSRHAQVVVVACALLFDAVCSIKKGKRKLRARKGQGWKRWCELALGHALHLNYFLHCLMIHHHRWEQMSRPGRNHVSMKILFLPFLKILV